VEVAGMRGGDLTKRVARLSALGVVGVAAVAHGCSYASRVDNVRTQAAKDLECPAGNVYVTETGPDTMEAAGCGKPKKIYKCAKSDHCAPEGQPILEGEDDPL